jgi:hypothetical protein
VAQPGNYKEQIISGSSVSDYQPVLIGVPAATTNGKGAIQLAGDLGGTPEAPTVPALAAKADVNTVNAHTSASQAHGADGAVVGSNTMAVALASKADATATTAVLATKQTIDPNCKPDGSGNLNCSSVAGDTMDPGSLGPYTCFPHHRRVGTTGTGTSADPWVNADGTAGIQTCVNQLSATGGTVFLAAGVFSVSAPVSIAGSGITIKGLGTSFSPGNFAMSPPVGATSIVSSVPTVFQIGATSSNYPAGGTHIDSIFLFGPSRTPVGLQSAAVSFSGNADQPMLRDLNINNFGAAVSLCATGYHTDTPILEHLSIIGNGYGITKDTSCLVFAGTIDKLTFADNDWHSIYYLGNPGDTGLALTNSTIMRGCRSAACLASEHPANVFWGAAGTISLTRFSDAAVCIASTPGCGASTTYGVADELQTFANGNQIANNWFTRTNGVLSGTHAITVWGNGTKIGVNSYVGFSPAIDIVSGQTDTIISDPGASYLDESNVRTVFNNTTQNAGDPDSTGNWNGHEKWAGLEVDDTVNGVTWRYTNPYTGNKIPINAANAGMPVRVTMLQASGGSPSISGCGVTSIGEGSKNGLGYFVAQTTGTCTVTLTAGGSYSAPHAINCPAVANQTHPGNAITQSGNTATTWSYTGTTVVGDVIVYGPCGGW